MRKLTLIAILLSLMCAAVLAQGADVINVSVNGVAVQFHGVGAQSVNGRVLVPLRCVLEQMGAFVGWDAPNRTVIAQRGDRDVVLPIGSKTAKVNGQEVLLDVPAVVMAGTTMVPLRFVGEALGADVKWNAAMRMVEITSGTAPPTDTTLPPPIPTAGITSFTHDAGDWLVAGDTLNLVLKGTPGGTASFEIPGVAAAMPMKETSSGKYEAAWTVPANAHSVSGAGVIAKLVVAGQSLLIQAGAPISIDAAKPEVQNVTPLPDSNVAQLKPGISATYTDGTGSGIDPGTVKLTVNGADVTADANVTDSFVSYKPGVNLPTGLQTVTLTVQDMARNSVTKTWKFTVKAASQIIKSVTFTAPDDIAPGDVIAVRMEGTAGGSALTWFAAADGSKVRQRAMQETSDGIYESEYTVRKDDSLKGFGVVGQLTTAAGDKATMEADKKISGLAAPVSAPMITAPVEGASVSSPVSIVGKAPAGSTVRLSTSYTFSVFTGSLDEQTVTANDKGDFQSRSISLSSLVGGKSTVYTSKAVVVGSDGTESDAAVVTYKKK